MFTGSYAVNPVNGQPVPIWIADYVLISYGTGAIMAVPAHDTRDFEFAQQFDLPIVAVVDPGATTGRRSRGGAGRPRLFHRLGTAINSGPYDGLATDEFKQQITADLHAAGLGRAGGQLQAARLALQPPAVLGRAVPDPARIGRRRATRPACCGPWTVRVAGRPAAPGRLQTARSARTAVDEGARRRGSIR